MGAWVTPQVQIRSFFGPLLGLLLTVLFLHSLPLFLGGLASFLLVLQALLSLTFADRCVKSWWVLDFTIVDERQVLTIRPVNPSRFCQRFQSLVFLNI